MQFFVQNLLFIVSFRFTYFKGFFSLFEFDESLSNVLGSYLGMVSGVRCNFFYFFYYF